MEKARDVYTIADKLVIWSYHPTGSPPSTTFCLVHSLLRGRVLQPDRRPLPERHPRHRPNWLIATLYPNVAVAPANRLRWKWSSAVTCGSLGANTKQEANALYYWCALPEGMKENGTLPGTHHHSLPRPRRRKDTMKTSAAKRSSSGHRREGRDYTYSWKNIPKRPFPTRYRDGCRTGQYHPVETPASTSSAKKDGGSTSSMRSIRRTAPTSLQGGYQEHARCAENIRSSSARSSFGNG